MSSARALLGLDDANAREDGSLIITIEPFGERLFVQGNSTTLAEFQNVAATIDTEPGSESADVVLDKPHLKTYQVLIDPELAYDTLGTMLESRDGVRMQQDKNTGAITVLGRAEDHQLVVETLTAISENSGGGFAIVPLINADPADVIIVLQNMMGGGEDDTTGPVLMADSVLNHIMVRGTPLEVASVKEMIAKLDASAEPTIVGPRTRRRILSMSERDFDELMPILPELLPAVGRGNKLNLILPEDRSDIKGAIQRKNGPPSELDMIEDYLKRNPASPKTDQPALPGARKSNQMEMKSPSTQFKGSLNDSLKQSIFVLTQFASINPILINGVLSPQETEAGKTSQESEQEKSGGYIPPAQIPSVPGAPVTIKYSKGSLILDSEDLDALDDLVYEIQYRIGDTDGITQEPTFFFLKHRPADQMMGFLENFFGMESSSGGGGGGGAGGLMGGMMSNMMGGGGDLLGDLLGGGTGGSSGAATFEGDVRFGIDIPFNALYVTGATDGDLDQINNLIDTFDQPKGPVEPLTLGEFRTIDILHRDPEELKTLIETQLKELLNSGDAKGGGGQNQEAAQMTKIMQQLAGGGKQKGNTSNPEEEKPKATLGVDPQTKQLLVHGPEFIYKEVLKMVIQLDKPELGMPPTIEIMPNVKNPTLVANTIKQMFGDKVEIFGTDGTSQSGGTPGAATQGTKTNTNGGAAKAQQDAARSAIINAMRQQQQAQGGRGQTARGGGGRGGQTGGARGGGGGGGGRGGRGR